MIRKIFVAVMALSLGGCATASGAAAADPVFPAAGPVPDSAVSDDAAYAALFSEEVASARAMVEAGEFSVRCAPDGQHWVIRAGTREATTPFECGELIYAPTLVRRKVTSGNSSLLMVIGSGMGVLSDGIILREDEDAARPLVAIPIENMWMFGQTLAENRLVLVTGEVSATGCGLIRHDKELTIDWTAARIISEREIPSPPLTCADQAAN